MYKETINTLSDVQELNKFEEKSEESQNFRDDKE